MYKTLINKKLTRWMLPFISIIAISTFSCKKLVESPIPTEFIAETNVYSTDATAIAVLNNLYSNMNLNSQPFQGQSSINLYAGLSADELSLYTGITSGNSSFSYFTNTLSQTISGASGASGAENWSVLFNYIFKCNATIEGLNKSKSLTAMVKLQLLGEAKFLRALYYFYIVNMFGDVPLVLTTDPEINMGLSRSSKATAYEQIIADLKESESLLSDNFPSGTLLSTTTERVRPTKWAATALLSRVYLYTEDWGKAEESASAVLDNTTLFGPLPSLNDAFLKNSREAIWQLQPTAINFNTQEARTLIIPASGPSGENPVYLSQILLNSFESGDQRKVSGNWIDSTIYNRTSTVKDTVYYANKYKIYLPNTAINNSLTGAQFMNEYFMVLRLGEQYLIRAEARAQLGNLEGAQSDLNAIRIRAGLASTTASTQSDLLTAILHERQVELFCEWGNRWFDLKRTGTVDEVMTLVTPLKSNGAVMWQSYQALYPLPSADLKWGINLVQNPGY